MFHAKKSGQDKNRNKAKFLDPRKDTHSRLKALRSLLELLQDHEIKPFFVENSVEAFYVFYEEFTNFELYAKSKGAKLKDELEELLVLLEKILIYLPDKIHSRWQFNSIGLILRKLLHYGNVLTIREHGVRLFMIWLQIVQENVDELNLAIFGSIIPGIPTTLDKVDIAATHRPKKVVEYLTSSISGYGLSQGTFNVSLESEIEWCVAEGCNPIFPPQQGDKVPLPEELTKKFLDRMLDYMTRKMLDIQWSDKHMRESGFYHIFFHFKRFYLPSIFPQWNPIDHIYNETKDIISVPMSNDVSHTEDSYKRGSIGQSSSILFLCQRAMLCWLIAFTARLIHKPKSSSDIKAVDTTVADSSELTTIRETSATTPVTETPILPHSKQYDMLLEAADIVRAVLYCTQENVLTVHEIFRQSFLMPLNSIDTMNHVLGVYREWFFKVHERPLFMLEPKKSAETLAAMIEREGVYTCDSPLLRTPSYKEAVLSSERIFFANMPVENVRAGFQSNLRFFIALTAQIFFMKQSKESLSKHADICRKVMKMYRHIVLEMRLDSQTWRQLLIVLLRIADHILTIRPPNPRHSTLSGQLAGYLLQTLFVTWIRASLQVFLTPDLWDEILRVGTSFTGWDELVKEWAATMETLTRVMARTVYGIDLQDPPLEKLTHRGKVKKFGRGKIVESASFEERNQSFTTGWGRVQEGGQSQTMQVCKTQPPTKPIFPRSSSEPGMQAIILSKAKTQFSDSALHRPKMAQRLTTEHINHKRMNEEFLQLFSPESTPKTTLAELAHRKVELDSNLTSFDSVTSGTNSVFLSSSHSASAFYSQRMIPEIGVDLNSDTESEGNNIDELCLYERLKEESKNSFHSLTTSQSLASLNSFLSESSQNLLSEDYESHDDSNSKQGDSKPSSQTNSQPQSLHFSNDKIEVESYVSSASNFSEQTVILNKLVKQDMSPHTSVLSDQDLINFELDVVRESSKHGGLDAQSIDSHVFALIDNENFNELRSTVPLSKNDIAEAPEEDNVEEVTLTHVHFAEVMSDENDLESKDTDNMDNKHSVEENTCSVIEGGTIEGWTPLSSVVLWKRMMGILGNINDVRDPEIHASIFKHLIELWKMLEVIQRNQGVSTDNKSTPRPPMLTPPLFFCSPWCFQAMSLKESSTHKPGRVLAFKLMCMMTMRNHGLKMSSDHLVHFFRLMHVGLTSADQDVINSIISQCLLFYSLEFQSSLCLILDFIYAANTIISTQYMTYPRKEAVSLLGSMICLPGAYPTLKVHQPGVRSNEYQSTLTGNDLREKILIPLLKASRNDPSCRARCVALSSLGLFIIESLTHLGGHQRIYECLALIISSLEFHNQIVSTIALDILWSLTFYYEQLAKFDKDLPLKIIEAMCHITLHLQVSPNSASDLNEENAPEFVSRLLLILLDWLMVVPKKYLLKSRTDRDDELTFLGLSMKIFKKCCEDASPIHDLERRRSLNVNQIFIGDSRPVRLARVHNDLSMDDLHGITDDDEPDFIQHESKDRRKKMLKLTAQYAISQILNYYENFPFKTGAAHPGSVVLECEDHYLNDNEENTSLLESNNVQFLLLNRTTLLSVLELPQVNNFTSNTTFEGLKTVSRFIVRDANGKYCWDTADLFSMKKKEQEHVTATTKITKHDRRHSRNLSVSITRFTISYLTSLPTWETVDPNADRVDQLLRYIGKSSPECLLYPDQQLNMPSPVPLPIDLQMQSSVVTSVLKQHNEEENYVHEISHDPRITASEILPPDFSDPSSSFHMSKMLLHELSYFSEENRQNIELLERNEQLLREIKNLDNRPCRETQKIAVFYVAPGQEDKQSILCNSKGSEKFEEFLSGMAWEVDLATHTGFMGGLEKNLSTGKTAPYFATHSLEVIFHVSTRMPGCVEQEELLKTKLRHLGNDEIHIIWSEHSRDFRRGIINTEFADVLIIIYPIHNNLFRIQIDRNPKIPPFGPLFDGAIIDGDLLPLLVRNTAVNAGRAKRATNSLILRHFEERARCIYEISQHCLHQTTFEDFCSRLFAPTLATAKDLDLVDSVHRTLSLPSRKATVADPTAVLQFLDMPDQSFRNRATSAYSKTSTDNNVYHSSSSNSLNYIHEDGAAVLSDSDQKEYKDRRKSLTKRLKKKATSMDVAMFGVD